MRKAKKKIDWAKLWPTFEKWTEQDQKACPKCGNRPHDYPDWEEQKKKIQQLVNKQLGP